MRLKRRLIAGLAVAVLWFGSGDAIAYPEFQYSSGNSRCVACHYAPAGGGLLNEYGRDEASSTISSEGDGRFFHGLIPLPTLLDLGGDVRIAGLAHAVRGGREVAAFPMQGDLYARLGNRSLSVTATVGVLAALREARPLSERIGSREYYAMYQARSQKWYVRAGRFFPVSGLRGPDHTAYVRRFSGLYLLEESHAVGFGGRSSTSEWHAAILTPISLHPTVGKHGFGASAYWERTYADDTAGLSLAMRGVQNEDGLDGWVVGTWKKWIESSELLIMAEIDVGALNLPGAGVVGRVAALGTLHWRPSSPFGLALSGHYFDPNTRFLGQERAAIDVSSRFFWRGHFELAALVRAEQGAADNAQALALVQLHYFL